MNARLSGDSTIAAWQAHPIGSAVIDQIAAQAGLDASSLALMRNIPLRRLIEADPSAPAGLVQQLEQQVNADADPTSEPVGQGWQERIASGRFEDQTVIVTGAGSGMGRAVASRIAREGGLVVAADIAPVGIEALAQNIGDRIRPVAGDITQDAGVEAILAAADGKVDGLANVAGLLDDFSAVHEVTDVLLRRVFEVNVFGMVRLTRAVVPLMLQAGHGTIVNVASEAALRGSEAGVAYTASKHAVIGLTRSSAYMYEPFGLRVNAVAPGGTLTGMRPGKLNEFGSARIFAHSSGVPLDLPEQLAATITFLLSQDSANLNGAIIAADGGESVV
ncbi:SDR family NAD(P)-dependent oxidoreductase [Jatrophihabitans endophyticus]|uniref:SDR family NAD(P)-dependent oxidoreductase n=1 Tax=Jatrophihabitans endophyticus TaxID=1206085 RepID=UPI0019F9445B|nr:SDR family NAD(P)-dependent oxidoreductase [Jatrophihabitans endophyticus]MBE7189846.1 SDR family NAD(P)-dependent oxidoreductase [Jatrophihabitans endophyticus]